MDFFRRLQANLTMNHLCTLLVGILLLISPYTTTSLIAMIAGILIAGNGLCDILFNLFEQRSGVVLNRSSLGSGIIRLILGVYIMLNTDSVLSFVSILFSIYLIADGLMGLLSGLEAGMLPQTVLSALIIVGGVIMLFNPLSTITNMVSLCGAVLIVDAVIGLITVNHIGRYF